MVNNLRLNFIKTVLIELYLNNCSYCFEFQDACSIHNMKIVQTIENTAFSGDLTGGVAIDE
jgi:hypothetical protein